MKLNTEFSSIYISSEIQKILTELLQNLNSSKIFVIVDENTKINCLPIIKNIEGIKYSNLIELESGELNKSIKSLASIPS